MRIAPLFALLGVIGCSSDPCAEYADYMCDCHPEEDCEEFQTVYASGNGDADQQESCAAELADTKDEDGADDYAVTGECATGDDTAI